MVFEKPLPKAVDMPMPNTMHKLPEVPVVQEEQQWTLWKEANHMFTALDNVAAQIRRTRQELERNIMEIERMLGSVIRPKQ
jgi:hypothetical protein